MSEKPEKKKKIDRRDIIHKTFRSEADIRDYFSSRPPIHCVSCKNLFSGAEPFDHELQNTLAIKLTDPESNDFHSVPRIVCDCGYKNTVLKLLYQTDPPTPAF